jgi:hypothetical protein
MARKAWIALVAMVIAVAGCAAEAGPATPEPTAEPQPTTPESIAESVIRGGLPAEAITADVDPSSPDQPWPFPTAGWLDGGARFAIVLVGSSSCPSFPSSMEVIDTQHLKIGITKNGGASPCSADMAPRTYVLPTPASIDTSHEITLMYPGGNTAILPPL